MEKILKPQQVQYKLLELLGEGGSGKVYRAFRVEPVTGFKTDIALKILNSKYQFSEMRAELEVLTKLRSPHCVSVYSWDFFQGNPSLVLERVEGVSLWELYQQHYLSEEEVLEVIRQTLKGLRDLLDAHLIHGDLSPKNILISSTGEVKLIDFGLIGSICPHLTGTPAYLSPSRWEQKKPTVLDDYFSLGIIWHELVNQELGCLTGYSALKNRAYHLKSKNVLLEYNLQRVSQLDITKNERAQKSLAHKVLHCLKSRKLKNSSVTQALAQQNVTGHNNSIFKFTKASLILFLLSIYLSLPSDSSIDESALLNVRTHNWYELTINETQTVHTPVTQLKIRPGKNVVKWRSYSSQGVLILDFKAHQTKNLTDIDFK